MLKIGVLGAGHLGKIHLKCIQLAAETYQLAGFYDPVLQAAREASENLGIPCFESAEALMDAVDVVDIVTPTISHYELAAQAIQKGKHVFIEKPLTHTLAEADALVRLSNEKGVQVQVGHVERFNPALLALEDMTLQPMFIEAHRLAAFNPRGTDVSVILDLMIHDIDIILSMVRSEVKSVSASGVAVVSETPDIANARIEFKNGCVANLTASRISLKQMRKVRLFQKDAYVSLDFLEKKAQVVRLYEKGAPNLPMDANLLELSTPAGEKLLHIHAPEIEQVNAIRMELETFARSIEAGTTPKVSIVDGYEALKLAYRIIEEIERTE
ncbi:MAG: Gfo/Idh/MocA family oxidoreductase [Saprospiraceae bacterium]|nr:Gfo/Idh/MocA family oxidoreductase [Saprospiraceae bacterium]